MKIFVKNNKKFYLFTLLGNISLTATLGYSFLVPRAVAQILISEPIVQVPQQRIIVTDLEGFNGVIKSIALSPDGQMLLVGSGDARINGVNMATQEVIFSQSHDLNDYTSIVVSSDQEQFAIAQENTIQVLSLKDGETLRTLRGHGGVINDLALSPDDRILVSVSSNDRTIRVWDFESGELLETLSQDIGPTTSVAFTPDGRMFITGAIGTDRTLKFWDTSTFRLIRTSPQQPGYINAVKITPDGQKLVAAVRNYIKVWDLTTGEELLNIKGPALEINDIAVSPDSRLVATANKEGNIMIFDLIEGRQITTLTGHEGWVLSLAFSPDGRYLYSGAEDKVVKIWQIQPELTKGHPQAPSSYGGVRVTQFLREGLDEL